MKGDSVCLRKKRQQAHMEMKAGYKCSGEWDCGEGVGGLEPKVGLGRWMRWQSIAMQA